MGDEPDTMQDDLIIRHLTGETSTEEEKQLLIWMAQLPENENHYHEVKKVFELSSNHFIQNAKQEIDINVDQEWNKFVGTVGEKEAPVRSLNSENTSRYWLKIAAAFLLLVTSGIIINDFVFTNADTQFKTSDSALSVVLPDGSKIMLNTHSQLSYSPAFGEKERRVILTGEGFFEVERDTEKPFVIRVNNAEVEVLGTSFNIQGYEDRKEIEVTVQTGLVKFSVPDAKQEVNLAAGNKGVYTKANNELSSAVNDDVNFLAWNTRKIIFIENDLRSVVEILNKVYGITITLPPVLPASCVVTVTFDHQTIESVLNVLKTTLNLEYRINGNQIEIISAGC